MLSAFVGLVFVLFASLIPHARGQCRRLRFTIGPIHGQRLENHVIRTIDTISENFCKVKCLLEPKCVSYNFKTKANTGGKHECELNNASFEHDNKHSGDLAKKENYVYRGAENACAKTTCQNNSTCQAGFTDREYQCLCIAGFTGHDCEMGPGLSCKQILDSGDSRGDGEYWIDPENNGNPLQVYCDMTTDGGGWLLIANFVINSPANPPVWTTETSYRGISNYHNNRMGITTSAMNELRTHLSFTQLRFHCSKQQGRTFHVTTVPNSTGEAVVQYFSGQNDTLPYSCSSFVRMKDDNSYLAKQCSQWGNDGVQFVGKWGHVSKRGETRMYDRTAFVAGLYHWMITDGVWLCDDKPSKGYLPLSSGDSWKIYLR